MERDFILLLDTSTDVSSVALCSADGETIVAERLYKAAQKHADQLAPLVEQMLTEMPEGGRLVAVGVAEGPGSYTGLRIGASYAKGLCFALDVPMVSISTPEVMVYTFLTSNEVEPEALLMPMIDARRMEVYSALYDAKSEPITDIEALILTEEMTQKSLQGEVGSRPLYYFGSGAEKAEELFSELLPSATLVKGIEPKASAMARRAVGLLEEGKTNDVAYWEPFYLKEYQAKKSQNKVLRSLLRR
ncbi:MAG: tRNA (adenosine(37)-N6)-threonylcarbamoyltransferase complex dimerization subunit type 1 TsaB [Porphyromonas sp.]|nr:tRNA (adenosine(37)-N6)-threonylcarbamoyltransferase complex dimerization subunit type 1 TsaB [Porphyromonas sp.]